MSVRYQHLTVLTSEGVGVIRQELEDAVEETAQGASRSAAQASENAKTAEDAQKAAAESESAAKEALSNTSELLNPFSRYRVGFIAQQMFAEQAFGVPLLVSGEQSGEHLTASYYAERMFQDYRRQRYYENIIRLEHGVPLLRDGDQL